MKKIITALAFIFTIGSLSAQQTIQSDDLADFHTISLSGNINAELIESDRNAIEIMLYEADIKKFKWSVSDGVLSVSLRPTVGAKTRADIRIYYRSGLRDVKVMDVKLTCRGPIKGNVLRVSVSGGNAALDVDVSDLEISATANCVAVVNGTAKYLAIRGTERSRVDTRGLEAVSADVEAATGAEVFVKASERLVAKAKNASSIYYAGNPEIVKDQSAKTSVGSGVFNIGYKE